jgi:hypothetical protein
MVPPVAVQVRLGSVVVPSLHEAEAANCRVAAVSTEAGFGLIVKLVSVATTGVPVPLVGTMNVVVLVELHEDAMQARSRSRSLVPAARLCQRRVSATGAAEATVSRCTTSDPTSH